MSFFKKDISKEEWDKKHKAAAAEYDKQQAEYSNGTPQDISLTSEQLRKIALVQKKHQETGKTVSDETAENEEQQKAEDLKPKINR
ncbi:MAG: hypothetical protein ACO1N3_01470 [Gammaproteobacteria bacterium]